MTREDGYTATQTVAQYKAKYTTARYYDYQLSALYKENDLIKVVDNAVTKFYRVSPANWSNTNVVSIDSTDGTWIKLNHIDAAGATIDAYTSALT